MGRQCAGSDGTGLAACMEIRSYFWSAKCTLSHGRESAASRYCFLLAVMVALILCCTQSQHCSMQSVEMLPLKTQHPPVTTLGLAAAS